MRSRVPFILASLAAFTASPALADIQITVDKAAQTLTVARDGAVLHTWPVSTGRVGRFTPSGNHQAFRMERDHYSREFDDAPMPHSIFFTKRGHAIHGSFETRKLGRPASGGCVRLAPENARVLFELVKAEGVLKTKVVVAGDERVALARADRQLTQRGAHNERGAGLPPTYAPPVEDQPRTRERYAAPRDANGPQYGYRQPQQQQYFYDGYQWRAYQGQRVQQQPYYGGGYAQPQYYQPRQFYD